MSKADRLVTAVIIGKVAAHGEMQTAARRMAAGHLATSPRPNADHGLEESCHAASNTTVRCCP
jgi:hypothetical protein